MRLQSNHLLIAKYKTGNACESNFPWRSLHGVFVVNRDCENFSGHGKVSINFLHNSCVFFLSLLV